MTRVTDNTLAAAIVAAIAFEWLAIVVIYRMFLRRTRGGR
jgi:hypothetical protein